MNSDAFGVRASRIRGILVNEIPAKNRYNIRSALSRIRRLDSVLA